MMPTAKILPRLAWSFSEPIPPSAEAFVVAAVVYAQEIDSDLDRNELLQVFPGTCLDIEYAFWIRSTESGPWTEVRKVVRIKADDQPLTYAAIVLRLHQAAYADLAEQDHHYFEGLYLLSHTFDPGVPAYEVYLGS